MNTAPLYGAGLGFRRELIPELETRVPACIDFFEIAPENWLDLGGALEQTLARFTERYPFVCHGLSLSLGGPAPLNTDLLYRVRDFMRQHRITLYTEHLSWCSDDGQLYDLLPIPFTDDAVHHVAARIRQTQDILEQQIAIENASYYLASPLNAMGEGEFLRAVLEEADCLLHLDINNIYVNSINFGFDAHEFLAKLPGERIAYIHTAGHFQEAPDLIIDTHGADVIEPVWQLLQDAYSLYGIFPTLLERDFNIPPLTQLAQEVERIGKLQNEWKQHATAA